MTIITQGAIPPAALVLDDIAKACSNDVNAKEAQRIKNKKKKSTCQKLGQDKHKCCEKKIQEHRDKNPPDGDPAVEGETGYKRPKFRKNKPVQPVDKNPLMTPDPANPANMIKLSRGALIKAAAASAAGLGKDAVRAAIGKALSGTVWPDAAVVGPPKRMVDFKFACPASHRKKNNKKYTPPSQSAKQERAHNALGDGPTITILH